SVFQPEIPPVSEKDGSKALAGWRSEVGGEPAGESDEDFAAVEAEYKAFAGGLQKTTEDAQKKAEADINKANK
ncbi:MAG: hypothetical protein V1817_01765, partial [Candidatus Micrarchaeota archaeon]